MKTHSIAKHLLVGVILVVFGSISPSSIAGSYNKQDGCTQYRLSAFGGDAGIRPLKNPKNFRQVSNGSIVGQICGSGHVTIELSKRNPDTHVTLFINGREYVFGQGNHGDKLANNWYRRYINVNLPYQSSQYGNKHGGNYSYQGHSQNHNQNHGQHQPYQPQTNSNYGHYNTYPDSNHQGYGHNQHGSYGSNDYSHHYNDAYPTAQDYQNHNDQYGNGHFQHKRKHHKASRAHKRAHKYGKAHRHYGKHFVYL